MVPCVGPCGRSLRLRACILASQLLTSLMPAESPSWWSAESCGNGNTTLMHPTYRATRSSDEKWRWKRGGAYQPGTAAAACQRDSQRGERDLPSLALAAFSRLVVVVLAPRPRSAEHSCPFPHPLPLTDNAEYRPNQWRVDGWTHSVRRARNVTTFPIP